MADADDGCYAYGMFGFVAGFFLGLFGLLLMLCECNGIDGARKKYFLIGWGISFLIEIAIIIAIAIAVVSSSNSY